MSQPVTELVARFSDRALGETHQGAHVRQGHLRPDAPPLQSGKALTWASRVRQCSGMLPEELTLDLAGTDEFLLATPSLRVRTCKRPGRSRLQQRIREAT